MTNNHLLSPSCPNILTRLGRKAYHLLFFPRKKERMVVRGGIRYYLNHKALSEKSIINRGVWERKQISYFFPKCRELNCEIFLDVGSYVGYYSLLAAKLGVFQQVHALEASPVTYPRLEKHISINNMTNKIQPYNVAASNVAKKVCLHDDYGRTKIHKQGSLLTIAAPLDSMFDFQGKNIAMKMDVETHEIPALLGAKALIENNNLFLQVEVHNNQVETILYLINTGWKLLHYCESDFYFCRAATSHA